MRGLGWLMAVAVLTVAAPAQAQPSLSPRPNIVLILGDDVGFTDLGAYGGEARTPHIDSMARRGAQFSRYYTSPLCSPSRAMLLTGMDNHRTGHATIVEVLPPELRGRPGYTMRLEPGVITIAERLRRGGYRTYVTGKWHLGHGDGDLPNSHGFDRSFVLDASGADNWDERPYMPYYRRADWFENGERARLPENFYSSEFIVDRMIGYLEADRATRDSEPFFAYLAFQAVHIPVQAPREFTERYDGIYDRGWEDVRAARWRRAQALGLIPQDAPITPPHPSFRLWNGLDPGERALYARSMQVHAGMLEAMDHHIGRFIAYLESRGLAENTIFVVTSDNGPEPSNPVAEPDFVQWMRLRGGYTRELGNLGERGSFVFIGPEWANATSGGALYKFTSAEGGMRVPLIMAGPGIAPQRLNARAFVTDVAPTLLERAGVALHEPAIDGVSMNPVLSGQSMQLRGDSDAVGMEVSGHSALYRGDYKLVRTPPPLGDDRWRLYNLASDPGETHDLAADMPDLVASMRADYEAYAARVGVQPLPAGYDVQRQVAHNTRMKQLEHYWWLLALVGAAILALFWGLALLARRIFRRRAV